MSYTNMTKIVKFNTLYEKVTGATKVASTDLKMLVNESNDGKYHFEITTTASTGGGTLTIKPGDCVSGVYPNTTFTVGTLLAGKTYVFALDTARFKALSGADKGKICFNGTCAGIITAIVLP